jgi:hypothetical protein
MTSRPMSKLSTAAACSSASATRLISPPVRTTISRRCKSTTTGNTLPRQVLSRRHLAQVRPEPISELWFTSSFPRTGPEDELLGSSTSRPGGAQDHKPPDERLIKLGKSMYLGGHPRIIHMLTTCSFTHSISSSPEYTDHSSPT